MKVKKSIILVTALSCLTCAGCAKEQPEPVTEMDNEIRTEETEQTENAVSGQVFPERFEETIDGVVFDMDIRISEEADMENLHTMTATLQQPDIEKAKAVFAAGRTVVEEQNDTGSGEDGIEFPCYRADYDDDTFLNISSNLTYSHTPVFEKINGAFCLYSHNNADRYAKDTVLESADPGAVFRERNRKTGCLAAVFIIPEDGLWSHCTLPAIDNLTVVRYNIT